VKKKFFGILLALVLVASLGLVPGMVMAHMETGEGSASGGTSTAIFTNLAMPDPEETYYFEIIGIDTTELTPDVYGGVRLRLAMADRFLGIQARTFPNPDHITKPHYLLFQSFECASDWSGWETKSSHGIDRGQVIGPYDLRLEMTQNPDSTWEITPKYRVPEESADGLYGPVGEWTTFWDGPWTTSVPFDVVSATLILDIRDGFTGGTLGYSNIATNAVVEAVVSIHPETLNLRAQGRWITAYVELPDPHDVEDIDVETVELLYNGESLDADWGNVENGVFMVKFDRATVAEWLEGLHDEEVELTVAGEVNDTPFEGTATIRVINPPPPGRGPR